jgi:hypothetical protein
VHVVSTGKEGATLHLPCLFFSGLIVDSPFQNIHLKAYSKIHWPNYKFIISGLL